MKKLSKIFLVILLYSSVTFTASADDYNFNAAHDRWHNFAENAMKSAQKIVDYNKPAFEVKLTKQERYYNDEFFGTGTSPVIYKRVWAKDKTIVTGWATANKKFHADYIETIDPDVIFMGGVHVGGSIRDLEKLFGTSINAINESTKTGIIYGSSQSEEPWWTLITHKNGIITEIRSQRVDEWPGGFPIPDSSKANNFMVNKRRQMGIPAPVQAFDDN